MKKELHTFLTAVMFYTRIPCPKWVDHSADQLNRATRYFPLVGWIVGAVTAAVYLGASYAVPSNIAILFSMIAGILLTGAFHEDGFADVCDGFGGGWTKEKILSIMKDSVLGAYGVIGITLLLLLKYLALVEITTQRDTLDIVFALWLGHSLSRTTSVWVIYTGQYVRENEDAKAKPIAKQMGLGSFVTANILGILPLVFFWKIEILAIMISVTFVKMYFSRYFNKWIGGYTGDCLGAVQQVAEVVIYLSLIALWKYI
ncbi:adenosylcobinamide-GDP ribazoletransferase [Reichenbachiella sp. 5M10]|nr:adenosylcobinamide-GDP ribazoletransferase [Reichenbachiella sp. 5M10]